MIRIWLIDAAGVLMIFALTYAALCAGPILAPCDPETELCEGQKP